MVITCKLIKNHYNHSILLIQARRNAWEVWSVARKYGFNSPKYVFPQPAPVREKEFDLDEVVLKAASDFRSLESLRAYTWGRPRKVIEVHEPGQTTAVEGS
jgi:hypothetical protein